MSNVTPLPYVGPQPAVIVPASPTERAQQMLSLVPGFMHLAESIQNTEFVPNGMRRRPEAILAALMSGAERGLGLMESLRSVHIIEGRPTLAAEAMRALVFAAGHDIAIVETSAQRATVVGRRAGSSSSSAPFTWTIDRARRARLTNKDNWVKYPEAMLLARASADLCRAVFPDVIAGLAASEEIEDATTISPTTTRRARRPALSSGGGGPAAGAADRGGAVAPADPPPGLDEIPGSDGPPTWGQAPAENSTQPDPDLAKNLHARIAQAFPDASSATRDRFRHALVAVVTRKRQDGPRTSSHDLTVDDQLALSKILVQVTAGQTSVTEGPDDTIEVRGPGGWRYTVALDPLWVMGSRGAPVADEPEPGEPT